MFIKNKTLGNNTIYFIVNLPAINSKDTQYHTLRLGNHQHTHLAPEGHKTMSIVKHFWKGDTSSISHIEETMA